VSDIPKEEMIGDEDSLETAIINACAVEAMNTVAAFAHESPGDLAGRVAFNVCIAGSNVVRAANGLDPVEADFDAEDDE